MKNGKEFEKDMQEMTPKVEKHKPNHVTRNGCLSVSTFKRKDSFGYYSNIQNGYPTYVYQNGKRIQTGWKNWNVIVSIENIPILINMLKEHYKEFSAQLLEL